jgi:hypothetical protein
MSTSDTLASVLAAALAGHGGATLTVGPGQQFETVSDAIDASTDGDVVAVQAGTYVNDFPEISTRVTLVAVGGRVTLRATRDLPPGQGIVTADTDVTITGFTLTGARMPRAQGQEGAAIRVQGGHLTLSHCYIHDNQEGLLAAADLSSSVTIQASEFARNGNLEGPGAGRTHNLHVGRIAALAVSGSYFHDAIGGDEIVSRARVTRITFTRITGGTVGDAGFAVDLPNGGQALLESNSIRQGSLAGTPAIISFGEQGGLYPGSALTLRNNLIDSARAGGWVAVHNAAPAAAVLTNTVLYGVGAPRLASGPVIESGTSFLAAAPRIGTQAPY